MNDEGYLQNNRRAWFLLQDSVGIERFKVRVWVVQEVSVVVNQKSLHVIEDEAKLICMLH